MTFDHVYAALVGGIVVLYLVYLGVGIGIGLTVLIVYRQNISRWLTGTGTTSGGQRIPPQAEVTLTLADDGVPAPPATDATHRTEMPFLEASRLFLLSPYPKRLFTLPWAVYGRFYPCPAGATGGAGIIHLACEGIT